MPKPITASPTPTPSVPPVVVLEQLPARIARMVGFLLQHQALLCWYPFGSIELHWKGAEVKANLGKVPLESADWGLPTLAEEDPGHGEGLPRL